MNNKGFTLVELLATILILAIISTIGVASATRVSKAIKEAQRKNVIKRIEVAASKYAYDTGRELVYVDTLIKNGYIDAGGNDDFVLKDPLDDSNMNCYLVKLQKQESYYIASFIDRKNNNDDICDENEYNSLADVKIEVKVNNVVTSDLSDWLSGEILLTAYSNTIDINCNDNDCTWNSGSGINNQKRISYMINNDIQVDTFYSFNYKANNQNYYSEVNLKIDNLAPEIQNLVINADRTITANIIEKGSGEPKICINTSETPANNCWENVNEYPYTSTTKLVIESNNYIHVKDKVGNINTQLINN